MAQWIEIEKGTLNLLDVLKLLADGKNFKEIQELDPLVDRDVISEIFVRVERYVRMHLLLDDLMYLQNKGFVEQEKFYRRNDVEFSDDDKREIERLIENEFPVDQIARIFLRDKDEMKHVVQQIKNKGG